jgi:hypothetical protein
LVRKREISAVGGHPMSLYLVSCEFSSGSEGHEKFNEQLDGLSPVIIYCT